MNKAITRSLADISPKPKAEAAYGLVVQFKLEDFDRFDQSAFNTVVSGESFTEQTAEGPVARPATSLISRETLKQGLGPGTLDSLKQFATVYNKYAQRPEWNLRKIDNLDSMVGKVYSSLAQWVGQQRDCDMNKIELEPLFIRGLKAFLAAFLEGEG